jgi:tRNA pseudouridine38-40 synthase
MTRSWVVQSPSVHMSENWFFLVLQYDGTRFCGWQRQPAERTVQGEVEAALERLCGKRVAAHAAGRTDTGVHALGQVVSFAAAREFAPGELQRAMNALTPRDIWIGNAGRAPDGFHARKHATARCYRYVLGCDPAAASPFRRPFEWDLCQQVDAKALAEGAALIVGEHGFRGLSATGQEKPHYRCTVTHAAWQARSESEGFIFTVQADRFLHRMVRFLVGVMVDVARERRPLTDMTRLLESQDNADASPPAPARGLYLVKALYPTLKTESTQ